MPRVVGAMYTTWQRDFNDLEVFAQVVDRAERN
jgi:hypothetical protein